MRNILLSAAFLATVFGFASCKKNEDSGPQVKPYTVPATYSFSNASYAKATSRVQMAVELDAYLRSANTGSAVVTLDAAKVAAMFNNVANPFSNASLNSSGVNLMENTTEGALYKSFADSVVIFNTGATAAPGTGGFVPRGTNKIIVGPRGLEYGQAYTKGVMSALFFKEAVRLLTLAKNTAVTDTAAAQAFWDDAFAYLGVPANYDSSITYASTDANRPVLWGGYLAERGKPIQAGGTIFQAFLKGRAAIGGYDKAVRDEQADVIMTKWEQLAAAAALQYVTAPTASTAVGNYGTQLHALSEGFGFFAAFKYRPATSKLSAADFQTLDAIIHKDFYELLNQPGFTDLVKAQTILKTTYGL
jgi:hypothetical protein